MIARFITGIGTGIETSTVPMYQSELCEAEKRGRLVSSEPLFVGVGIEIAYWFDYGLSFVPGSIAWRLPIACQMIFAFVSKWQFLHIQDRRLTVTKDCDCDCLGSTRVTALSVQTWT